MKSVITIEKENFITMNSYTVFSSNGSRLYRAKNNHRHKNLLFKKDEYAVCGTVNGKFVYIECKDYRSAKQLFMAMQ